MPYNVPSGDANRVSVGQGLIFLGPAGTTPNTDVGYVSPDGMLARYTRTPLLLEQGQPRTLIQQYCIRELAEIEFVAVQWDTNRLAQLLGAGTTTSTATEDTFSFGGAISWDSYALRLRLTTPAGETVNLYMWQAQGSGEMEIPFPAEDLETFPARFTAIRSTTDWAGNTLGNEVQLTKVLIEK